MMQFVTVAFVVLPKTPPPVAWLLVARKLAPPRAVKPLSTAPFVSAAQRMARGPLVAGSPCAFNYRDSRTVNTLHPQRLVQNNPITHAGHDFSPGRVNPICYPNQVSGRGNIDGILDVSCCARPVRKWWDACSSRRNVEICGANLSRNEDERNENP